MSSDILAVDVAGIRFQNPVLLASGTAAYGREIHGVIDLEALAEVAQGHRREEAATVTKGGVCDPS